MPPNGQLPVKLDRNVASSGQSISGIWRITDGVFFGRITDPLVITNGPEMALCGGKSRLSVELTGQAQIKITPLTTFKCNGVLGDSLTKAVLYRINNLKQPPVLSFLDKDFGLIAEFTLDQPYRYGAKIDFNGVKLMSKAVDPFAAFAANIALSTDPFADINNNIATTQTKSSFQTVPLTPAKNTSTITNIPSIRTNTISNNSKPSVTQTTASTKLKNPVSTQPVPSTTPFSSSPQVFLLPYK